VKIVCIGGRDARSLWKYTFNFRNHPKKFGGGHDSLAIKILNLDGEQGEWNWPKFKLVIGFLFKKIC